MSETARPVALGDRVSAPYDESVDLQATFIGAAMSSGFLVQARESDSVPAPASVESAIPPTTLAARHRQRLWPLENKPAGSLLIHEIYRSLQGESTFAGLPCVFVRLTACNLRCGYCDTPHAFTEGQVVDLDAVMTQVLELGDQLVEITGGEPLLQAEVYPLMTRLADTGKTVLLETSGGDRNRRGRPPRSCDSRHQDTRLGRGRRQRLEQSRPAQADRRNQGRRLQPRRFRLGDRNRAISTFDSALSCLVQCRLRPG